jgi:putative phosphoesterase
LRATLRHTRTTIATRPDGALRLVVVADSHAAPHPNACACVAAQRPDHILHAGDIGDLELLAALGRLAPVTWVRGNIDRRGPDLPDAVTVAILDGAPRLTLLLLHAALHGTRLAPAAVRLARAEGAALVVCGHSHLPFLGSDQGLAILNPGSIGPRRHPLPIVFAVIELRRGGASFHHVSCETGARWEP